MPVPDYVELLLRFTSDHYRLINRHVEKGFVKINKNERYDLLRERIRCSSAATSRIGCQRTSANKLAPKVAEIKKVYQEQMLRQFGKVEETAFPPCMQALITALAGRH